MKSGGARRGREGRLLTSCSTTPLSSPSGGQAVALGGAPETDGLRLSTVVCVLFFSSLWFLVVVVTILSPWGNMGFTWIVLMWRWTKDHKPQITDKKINSNKITCNTRAVSPSTPVYSQYITQYTCHSFLTVEGESADQGEHAYCLECFFLVQSKRNDQYHVKSWKNRVTEML